jgi:hypothetical protein
MTHSDITFKIVFLYKFLILLGKSEYTGPPLERPFSLEVTPLERPFSLEVTPLI